MRTRIQVLALWLTTSMIAPPGLASTQEQSVVEDSRVVLDAMGKHLNTIAILDHCGKKGIAKELQDKLIPAIMIYGRGDADVASLEDTKRFYREAQIYISGVVKGIRLAANVGPGDSLCSIATDTADEILSDPNAPWVR